MLKNRVITNMKGETQEIFPEPVRRIAASAVQWVGWLGVAFIYIWAITHYDPAEGRFVPQWLSFGFFVCLFLGIQGTMLRSRMRLNDTIIYAFKAGVDAVEAARLTNLELNRQLEENGKGHEE